MGSASRRGVPESGMHGLVSCSVPDSARFRAPHSRAAPFRVCDVSRETSRTACARAACCTRDACTRRSACSTRAPAGRTRNWCEYLAHGFTPRKRMRTTRGTHARVPHPQPPPACVPRSTSAVRQQLIGTCGSPATHRHPHPVSPAHSRSVPAAARSHHPRPASPARAHPTPPPCASRRFAPRTPASSRTRAARVPHPRHVALS